MKTTRYNPTLLAAAVVLLLGAAAIAQTSTHVMATFADTKWGPAPPMLPPGAQIAVLAGDPGKPAPYTVRLKFPAGYVVPAHSHPTDENVAVVSGDLFIGMGNKLNKTGAMALGRGGYALMPAHENHFAFTNAETTVLLYGIGPVEFKYVNSADDPRGAKN
jgi:quercetin dioxygenase-like cupin family protein